MCEKDYIWNRATCSGKNGKYLAGIIDDSVITCDEIQKKQKLFQQMLMKKMQSEKQKVSIFTCFFISYHCVIDSGQYLLLPDEIQFKAKTFIAILCKNNKLKEVL